MGLKTEHTQPWKDLNPQMDWTQNGTKTQIPLNFQRQINEGKNKPGIPRITYI
jgi:hypothetical protein